ncbi:MAG TPA: hypothetical protein VH206_17255 [Xanthobacteraceae bacterium]|jgi:hypothetical protein|nr:hypothetical protein [Xanthobacteraceae bacterium]
MPRILAPALSSEEWTSLNELSRGLLPAAIADEHKKRLMYLGYVTDSRGVLALTRHGEDRLAVVEFGKRPGGKRSIGYF